MTFMILNPNSPQWMELFEKLPLNQQDVFYSPDFASVCQQEINQGDEVLCAAMFSKTDVLLYPFVKRCIGKLTGLSAYDAFYDIVGLYGRGGVVSSWNSEDIAKVFHEAMATYCKDTAIVCGFDRYHPVIGNEDWAFPETKVMEVGGFVAVDLRPDMELIEKSFKQSVRKDVRKAQRNAVTCFHEDNCDHLDDYLQIYMHTMNRNSAAQFYFFQETFFRAIAEKASGQFRFFYAEVEGEIVSCELVLYQGKYAHSFLGGTKQKALSLGTNPALKREIISVMKEEGVDYFLLGGGAQENDGIFKFKKAYAPQGVLPSRIGGTIWDQQIYDQLKQEFQKMGKKLQSGRFQFYDMN